MSPMRRDLIGSALILVVTAVFWMNQDFTTDTDVIFPRFVLTVLTVLALVIAVSALVRARRGAEAEGEEPEEGHSSAARDDLPPEASTVQVHAEERQAQAAAADSVESGAGGSGAGTGAARAATAPTQGTAGDEADETGEEDELLERPGRAARWVMPASAALLIAWGAAFGLFGITLSGVVAFVVTAVFIRRGLGSTRRLLVDIGVAVVVALFCWAVFTRVLFVPLPVSVLLGV